MTEVSKWYIWKFQLISGGELIEQNLEASKFEGNNNISRYEKRTKVTGLSQVDMEYICGCSLKCHSCYEIQFN